MVRRSVPDSSRWGANEWRKVWQVMRLLEPTARAHGSGGGADGGADGTLGHGLMEVRPSTAAGLSVPVGTGRGEQPLPGEQALGARSLAAERQRQFDVAGALGGILGVGSADERQLLCESDAQSARQQGDAIPATLGVPHDEVPDGARVSRSLKPGPPTEPSP